ncbi:protein of unknown function [Methylocaldum szegediense]|uniref:Uncharacterized protein n=1 Tax=Methylocaldum szegediense TaxID=73780 RepID=A0ABN8WVY3_9GAMM|nr:protein of unknown function [Methylocaldum szegediense]
MGIPSPRRLPVKFFFSKEMPTYQARLNSPDLKAAVISAKLHSYWMRSMKTL